MLLAVSMLRNNGVKIQTWADGESHQNSLLVNSSQVINLPSGIFCNRGKYLFSSSLRCFP